MATFHKRGKAQWEARVRRRGYPPQSKTFSLKIDAERWARDIEAEMDRGVFQTRSEAESWLLEKLIERYEEEVTPEMKNPDEPRILGVLKGRFGAYTLATLQPKMINEFKNDLLDDGLAPSTINNYLSKLSAVIRHAETEWSITIPFNPCSKVKLLPVDDERTRRLGPGEEEALLKDLLRTTNAWARPAMIFAIETAMRAGEIFGLKWSQVDTKRKIAHLPETKNGNARDVPLSKAALALLDSLPRNINGFVFSTKAETERDLYNSQRSAITRWKASVNRLRGEYVKQCEGQGIEPGPFMDDLRFHDLRREATSRLSKKVPNVIELSRITGHKDLNMLARYYDISAEELAEKIA